MDQVRWGILATGGIASTFTEQLGRMPDAEIAAVASRSAGTAAAFAERFGIPRAHGSWEALAADDGVDVVYVATPHSAHRAAAGLCLTAGRAVLCEKPFTLNVAEATELVELARSRDRFLMEAMWTYCNPVVREALRRIRDGAIGEVRAVQADFGIAGPFPAGHRLLDPAQGGGALLDLGVYPVAFAQLVLGEPAEVQARAALTGEGVDTDTGMLLGWDSGAVAVLSCSLTARTPTTAAVTGTAGRIEFPRGFIDPRLCVLHRPGREPEEITVAGELSGMQHEAAEVMRCLRAGERESPLVPLDGTLAVMRTLDTVRERIGVRYPGEG
ncbi:Gfo/Idh/MocA family protein [Streptomyces zingiberis]|uniref:Gfo/Idh/MocA family oxidoreductase n=1 Tax=Streptomyces zingiberis TaxID=2053010 RepID=A0ABX1BRH4_9ACTN|nr:Gfo/Idh/MocA family oxidoreductase [Streptomyces zingiberis]NJP99647.1 Gfo/Idh/MocA family oxidoreductase [Streptomyces zingiberis]